MQVLRARMKQGDPIFNFNDSRHLTAEQRLALLKELSPAQQKVLFDWKRQRIRSENLTTINRNGFDWYFVDYKEYPWYDPHNPKKSPLKCMCGKHVKYLYYCENAEGETKGFGINHLVDEAGIPLSVAKQVRAGYHTIDLGVDSVLIDWARGKRFPYELYAFCQKHNLLKSSAVLMHVEGFLEAFRKVDLPIYKDYLRELEYAKIRYESERDRAQQAQYQAEREQEEARWEKIKAEKAKRQADQLRKERERQAKLRAEREDIRQAQIDESIKQQKASFNNYQDFLRSLNHEQQLLWKAFLCAYDKIVVPNTQLSKMRLIDPANASNVILSVLIFKRGNARPGDLVTTSEILSEAVTEFGRFGVSAQTADLQKAYDNLVEHFLSFNLLKQKDGKITINKLNSN